jgi:hypothetical protein
LVSEAELQATGLAEKILETYRLAGAFSLPLAKRRKLAKKLSVSESTVKRHLSRVRQGLGVAPQNPGSSSEDINPVGHAKAVVGMAKPGATATAVAKECGVTIKTAQHIGEQLNAELQPLGRELADVRIEDLTKRFGTLARDAVDSITLEKLQKASARDLAIISGVAVDKFQLLRGQPTSRMEIGDRRKMDELMVMMFKEAKRRGIEIDVTPEGGVTAKRSPFKNAAHQREVKKIQSGDPAETLVPA